MIFQVWIDGQRFLLAEKKDCQWLSKKQVMAKVIYFFVTVHLINNEGVLS